MKLTRNNLINKLSIIDNEVIKLIMEYKKMLPILDEEGEGFCINSRDLHKQLEIKDNFATWIKERISKYDFVEEEDYIANWYKDGVIFDDWENPNVKLDKNNTNQMVRNGYSKEFFIVLSMAKELAMVQNNANGKVARRYFITIEKVLKDALKWERIRKPEKERYKEMCIELDLYMQRNENRKAEPYHYINEANALNRVTLGANAKNIRMYLETQDNKTREWLNVKYNTYVDKMQELDIMYLKMNMNKEVRYNLIQQGFTALFPHASFVMEDIDIKKQIKLM